MQKDKVEQKAELTAADKMWQSIKDLKLEMFALPNQFVHMYCKPINIEPTKLYLVALNQASSFLPALENALGSGYTVEKADRFILVSVAPPVIKI